MPISRFVAEQCRRACSSLLWGFGTAGIVCSAAVSLPALANTALADTDATDSASSGGGSLEEVTVSAQRLELLGTASSASEGVVSDTEMQLTPAYRPGQLLETVPGLIVTLHSGEGKANQYLLRGYNLDHGTDMETYVDGIPVNQVTHAHGQGHTDMNFLVPELANGLTYTKGPYYANVGDFGAVGSVRVGLRDTIPDQISVTAGSFDFQRYFAAGSQAVGSGNLLAAAEIQHYDGPFSNPDDARKENVVLRYSDGDEDNGYSLTGMFYHQLWTNTTDIPLRAITEGFVGDRFGTLDPTDGGRSQRASLSLQFHEAVGDGQLTGSSYFEYNQLHIYNDFTQFLVDPIHGDQEDQFEIEGYWAAPSTTRCRHASDRLTMIFPPALSLAMICWESAASRPRRAYRCLRSGTRRPSRIRTQGQSHFHSHRLSGILRCGRSGLSQCRPARRQPGQKCRPGTTAHFTAGEAGRPGTGLSGRD